MYIYDNERKWKVEKNENEQKRTRREVEEGSGGGKGEKEMLIQVSEYSILNVDWTERWTVADISICSSHVFPADYTQLTLS